MCILVIWIPLDRAFGRFERLFVYISDNTHTYCGFLRENIQF
ncbi:hypothetical protein VCHA37P203_50054 [Vibrio chagasii]|nr:hypothetical protein VCHA52P461_50273 [Vibrio chagasii]CAH7424186.1 hypothetical protein VCHA38O210_30054 [Vibrio chagasii]CAH7447246.1 hypothetical protein VCHA37P203_50054 [Vibrio chagasii]